MRSQARRIFVAVAQRQFQLVVTSEIIAEYEEVSRRPAFAGKKLRRAVGLGAQLCGFGGAGSPGQATLAG